LKKPSLPAASRGLEERCLHFGRRWALARGRLHRETVSRAKALRLPFVLSALPNHFGREIVSIGIFGVTTKMKN